MYQQEEAGDRPDRPMSKKPTKKPEEPGCVFRVLPDGNRSGLLVRIKTQTEDWKKP